MILGSVAVALVLSLFLGVGWLAFGQSSSSSKRELNQTYRLYYYQTDIAFADSVTIRFPEKEHGVNWTHPDSIGADSIRTTTSGSGNAIRWVQLVQLEDFVGRVQWRIWSPAFPAGTDTVYTSPRIPTFTFGGCTVDSVRCYGSASLADIQVWISD
jgi:hypothetical protein